MASVRALASDRVGSYVLAERLGAGGMAEVFVARRDGPGGFSKRFALKRILPQLSRDPRFAEMFCDEARVCAALNHPNIVQVVDFGEHAGELFMAMEFIDGVSCARLLRSVAARGEVVPVGAALFIASEVLRALAFAHGARDDEGRALGIVHRDVSPGNILISRIGEVKLSDFGIVRCELLERRTSPGELKGKMGYMSPEQSIGGEIDFRSDLFTVGIVLAEMLMAKPLFPGRSELEILQRIHAADVGVFAQHGAHLPRPLFDVVVKALERDRERRHSSAAEFGAGLRDVARHLGLALDDSALAPWLSGLGLLPSSSGMHEVSSDRPVPVQRGLAAPGADAAPVAPRGPRRASHGALAEPPREYRVLVHSGQVLGPLSLGHVLELFGTGRLDGRSRLSLDGERFWPPRRFPELAFVAERREFAVHADFGEPDVRRGLQRDSIASFLYDLTARRETGLLQVQTPRRHKRVFLQDGAPIAITSSDRSELLGHFLVRNGLASPGSVERVVSDAHRRVRVGEALVARGALKPAALLRGVVAQVEARFVELGTWTDGVLTFNRGLAPSCRAALPGSTGVELVTRMVRECHSDDDVAQWLAPLRHNPIARVPAELADLDALGLTPEERVALARAGGAPSLESLVIRLASDGTAGPMDTLRAVFVGLSASLLAMPGWPLKSPRP